MSANLDLVRSIYAAWERGDYFTNADWAHPDIEYAIIDGPSPGNWTGLPAMADAWRDLLSATEAVRTEAEEYRDLDHECVLVLAHYTGRGKKSELDTRAKGANVFHVRDGRVARLVVYFDRDRAFTDLGIEG
jgi:ketosteroid isomerase-like protein